MNFRARSVLAAALLAAFAAISMSASGGISLVISAPSHAPPPLRAETHGNAPFGDAAWIDGRWDWRDGRYVWQHGHWERARRGFHRWMQGQWVERGNGWIWMPGEWR